jgi:CheY-like chemotaxis protein
MLSNPLVLIVEDEALVRFVAASMLQDAGFDTLEAASADDAWLLLQVREDDVDVLFSDVQLPGSMDGLELATRVHDRWPSIKLVLTSGGVRLAQAVIPDDGLFLPKPYLGDEMVKAVRGVL